jgi:hypothetical protein
MEKQFNTKDALGQEIEIGKHYGYSNSSNGLTTVKVAKAIAITKTGMLSMEVISHKSAIYNDELIRQDNGKNINVKPSCLFPVDIPVEGIKEQILRLVSVKILITDESFVNSLIGVLGGVTQPEIDKLAGTMDNELHRSIFKTELGRYVNEKV